MVERQMGQQIYQEPDEPKDIRGLIKHWENLLFKASRIIYKFGYHHYRIKRDGSGIICLEYNDFYLCARSYIWKKGIRDKVSAHKLIFDNAVEFKKAVIMYIEAENKFFKLDPKRVLEDDETSYNRRGPRSTQVMANFNIRLGEEVFQPQMKLTLS